MVIAHEFGHFFSGPTVKGSGPEGAGRDGNVRWSGDGRELSPPQASRDSRSAPELEQRCR